MTKSIEDQLARILDRLDNVRSSGAGHSARCPAHDDQRNSLSVSAGAKGGTVVHCHAGCTAEDIVTAVGLAMTDLAGAPYVEATYVYQHADGTPLWTVERWANPKDFRVVPALPPPAERMLYNLPWLDYARRARQVVYVVEGEKDVETLREYGLIGTCNVGGAGVGKWLPHYAESLAELDVVVLADNDEPGIRHARAVYRSVREHARSASLARPVWGKDVTELLTAGYPIDHVEPVPEEAPLASVLASSVRRSRVRWAWERYIPMGTMSIIEGDPGDGKSTLTCDLIARWSTGTPMPDGSKHDGPWHTMMVSIEDDPAATIVPRLMASGANLDHVVLVTGGQTPELPYNLGVDLGATERQVRQYDIKVLVLDPLMAFLPDRVNGLVDAEIRKALGPLQTMARRLDIAVVVVRHLTKSATRALYAGSGSIGIIGAARAAFLVRPNPDDPQQRVIAPTKANLVRKPPALGFAMEDDEYYDVGRIRWTGAVEIDADVLFEGKAEDNRGRRQAGDWLEHLLDNTFMTWKEVVAEGKRDGFSEMTLRRARDEVARSVRNPSIGGTISLGTYWHRQGQWPLDASQTATEMGTCSAIGVEQVEQMPTSATSSDDDREAELMARDRICDVCGSPGVLFLNPHYVIRCRSHDPRRWSL